MVPPPLPCSLLPGAYGLLMQAVLFLCVCGVLAYKKAAEGRGRTWFAFLLDSSKQMVGAAWIHALNLACSVAIDRHLSTGGDQCLWYWLNIVVDTTLGVAVEYVLLETFTGCLQRGLGDGAAEEFQGGHYYEYAGTPPEAAFRWRRYAKQLALWLLVVSLMKLCMVALMLALRETLVTVATWLLRPLEQRPRLKLAVVMILTPLCMNAFQFWVVDDFLKKRETGAPQLLACE
jgi:hypothetical protein